MTGHGSPHASPARSSPGSAAASLRIAARLGIGFLIVLLVFYGSATSPIVAAPDDVAIPDLDAPAVAAGAARATNAAGATEHDATQDIGTMRLRIAWGGGAPRQWSGTVELSAGSFSEMTPLGVDADETGSMRIERDRIVIRQRSPRTYDALDVLVRAPDSAELTVRLATAEDAALTSTGPQDRAKDHIETIPLARLQQEIIDRPIGHEDNRLLVMRTPGDSLRVSFAAGRDTLVFSPGEMLDLTVHPHLINAAAGAKIRLQAHLAGARGGRETWSQEAFRDIAADRTIEPWPLSIKLPDAPGVYDVQIQAQSWGLRQRFDPAKRFVPGPPLATRVVQVVVFDGKSPDDAATTKTAGPLAVVVELDPANPRWWKRYIELPQLDKLALAPKNSWDYGKVERWEHPQLHSTIKLAPDAWEAFPLPIEQVGVPHIVEVDYPSDMPQSLGISILDPNAAGELAPIGLDSGVYVTVPAAASEESRWLRHRLIFWPRTKTPLLLLTNRDSRKPAVHGRIRVLAGGPKLTPIAEPGEPPTERLLAAYYERPLFPENFCASEARDAWSGKSLDDWRTFYEADTRFAEYLQHVGYGGAMVAVYSEGSTIYPSRVVQPTPRHDTGVFFSTGQDPMRKDALELLLRIFDRERLTMIPAVQFDTPLPRLEALLDRPGANITGLLPVGLTGEPIPLRGSSNGASPYYNILDDRVQSAMLEVIAELVTRYAQHPSLAGVAIQLSGDGYAVVPGLEYSLDDVTWAAFERDTGESLASRGRQRFADRGEAVRGPKRKAWLRWRAARVARFQQRAAAEVAKAGRDLRLFISAAGVWDSADVRNLVRPSLTRTTTAEEALLALGLDVNIYSRPEFSQVTFLRPRRYSAPTSLEATASDEALNQSAELDRALSRTASAALAYHEPSRLRLASFDEKSPLGKDKTYIRLTSQFAPSDWENRRRFVQALAASDTVALFDGGNLLTLGQEASTADLFAVYRHLPAGAFDTLPGRTQPVTIRTRNEARRTLCYLVNDSPWTVTVDVEVAASARCRVASLAPHRRVNDLVREQGGVRWRVTLDPYDVVGATFSEPEVVFSNAQIHIDPHVAEELQRRVADLGARSIRLASPPLYPGLANAGFEAPRVGGQIPQWTATRRAGVAIELTDGAAEGKQAVDIASNGPVASLYSDWFDAPPTGRLAIQAMLQTPEVRRQPAVRVAVETQLGRQSAYRWRAVGAAPSAIALRSDWSPYLFPFDGLSTEPGLQVRVRVDLMSAGDVRVDDVKLLHLSFTDNEKTNLTKIIALADLHLTNGNLAEAARVLDGYWPRYLAANVPLPEPQQAARTAANHGPRGGASTSSDAGANADAPTAAESETTSPGVIDRLKKLKPF
jgi:hypothetical protein